MMDENSAGLISYTIYPVVAVSCSHHSTLQISWLHISHHLVHRVFTASGINMSPAAESWKEFPENLPFSIGNLSPSDQPPHYDYFPSVSTIGKSGLTASDAACIIDMPLVHPPVTTHNSIQPLGSRQLDNVRCLRHDYTHGPHKLKGYQQAHVPRTFFSSARLLEALRAIRSRFVSMIGPDNSYRCPNRTESWSGPQHYYYCLEMRLRSSRAWVPLSHHFPVAVDAQTTDMGLRGEFVLSFRHDL